MIYEAKGVQSMKSPRPICCLKEIRKSGNSLLGDLLSIQSYLGWRIGIPSHENMVGIWYYGPIINLGVTREIERLHPYCSLQERVENGFLES